MITTPDLADQDRNILSQIWRIHKLYCRIINCLLYVVILVRVIATFSGGLVYRETLG